MSGLIEGLPDMVTLQCLARLPLSQYRSLQLVCKSWHAAVRSSELVHFRKALCTQEEWLFVCGHTPKKVWEAYDPLANKWSLLPVLPTSIINLEGYGAVGCNGKLYVIGGTSDYVDPCTGEREPLSPSLDGWVFDPILWKWSAIAPMPTPRLHFACMSYEGKIVVVGGWNSREKPVFDAEVYNVELNKWQNFPRLNEGPSPVTFGIVLDGKMHVFHKSEKLSQVYESANQSWIVEECNWAGGAMAVVKGEPYVVRHGVVSREHHSQPHRSSPLCSWPECLNRKCFAVAGLGPDLYVVGGVIRPRLSSSEISYLHDVDICTVEGETEDRKSVV